VDEHFYPYLAGFLDGEGCITVIHQSHRNSNGNKTLILSPRVTIYNSHLGVIKYIYSQLGFGDIQIRQWEKLQRRTHYQLDFHNYEWIVSLLQPLLPYLVVKAEQAKLVVEYCGSRLLLPIHSPYTEQELRLAEMIRQLNRVVP